MGTGTINSYASGGKKRLYAKMVAEDEQRGSTNSFRSCSGNYGLTRCIDLCGRSRSKCRLLYGIDPHDRSVRSDVSSAVCFGNQTEI